MNFSVGYIRQLQIYPPSIDAIERSVATLCKVPA